MGLNSGTETRDLHVNVGQEFANGTVLKDLLGNGSYPVADGKVVIKGLASQQGVILSPVARR
ncbi:hypothetical protein D3C86_1920550 [compost metagenome]